MQGNAKLDEIQVKEILILLKAGFTQQQIAEKYSVSQVTISCIKTGKLWKYLQNAA